MLQWNSIKRGTERVRIALGPGSVWEGVVIGQVRNRCECHSLESLEYTWSHLARFDLFKMYMSILYYLILNFVTKLGTEPMTTLVSL
jgi:hypothetical protein